MEWRTIAVAPAYEVSRDGRVRRGDNRHEMRPERSAWGYLFASFRLGRGRRLRRAIHLLVYEAFVAPVPRGYVVNHKDGRKLNNTPENLEAVSKSEDRLHAQRSGLHPGPPKRLDREGELRVFQMRSAGLSQEQIARTLGVSRMVVRRVLGVRPAHMPLFRRRLLDQRA